MARYFGVPLRNGLPIGLGSTIAINRAVRQGLPPPSGDALLQEDGTSYFELQDGTGYILLEGLMPTLWLDFQNSTSLDSRITFTRASNATYFNSAGVLTTAGSGVARFDYNPSTLQPRGLLIEEQRTNSLLQSQDFTTTWVAGASTTVTANAATAPDGTVTADRLQLPATSGTFVRQSFSALATTTYTISVFARSLSGTSDFALSFSTFASTTQTATTSWQRFTFTFTTVGAVSDFISINNGNDSYATDIYIWGAQLEVGAFATSYIPTTTTALTRNADVASMTGTNFSSWYNASEGTFVAQYFPNAVAPATTGQTVFNTNDGTSLNAIQLSKRANVDASTRYTTDAGGSGQTFSNLGVFTATQTTTAVAYKVNDFAGIKSGGSLVTDTLGIVPALDRMVIGADRLGAGSLNGTIQRLAYYPTRLPNTTLQALTA